MLPGTNLSQDFSVMILRAVRNAANPPSVFSLNPKAEYSDLEFGNVTV